MAGLNRTWCVVENFVKPDLVKEMLVDLHAAELSCAQIQKLNGIPNTEGTVHHLIGAGYKSFMKYLETFEALRETVEEYFGGKFILHSFGGNLLRKGNSYANSIHRDIRSHCGGDPLVLNSIVTLDDFTAENGATWIFPYERKEKPSDGEFNQKAVQMTAPAGSVIFFNSNFWHRAGENKTDVPRRSGTPMFSRPFIKPGFDYCKALGHDVYNYTPWMRQVLGWNARVPSTLSEWYRIPAERFYLGDQG